MSGLLCRKPQNTAFSEGWSTLKSACFAESVQDATCRIGTASGGFLQSMSGWIIRVASSRGQRDPDGIGAQSRRWWDGARLILFGGRTGLGDEPAR